MTDYAQNAVQPIANGFFDTTGGALVTNRAKGCTFARTGVGTVTCLLDAGLGVDLGNPGATDDELAIRLTGQIGAAGTFIQPQVSVAPANTGGAGANQLIFTIQLVDLLHAVAPAAADGACYVEVCRAY